MPSGLVSGEPLEVSVGSSPSPSVGHKHLCTTLIRHNIKTTDRWGGHWSSGYNVLMESLESRYSCGCYLTHTTHPNTDGSSIFRVLCPCSSRSEPSLIHGWPSSHGHRTCFAVWHGVLSCFRGHWHEWVHLVCNSVRVASTWTPGAKTFQQNIAF